MAYEMQQKIFKFVKSPMRENLRYNLNIYDNEQLSLHSAPTKMIEWQGCKKRQLCPVKQCSRL